MASEFVVEDNINRTFSNEEIKIRRVRDKRVSICWVMSFEELVALQASIATYIAGDRLG